MCGMGESIWIVSLFDFLHDFVFSLGKLLLVFLSHAHASSAE